MGDYLEEKIVSLKISNPRSMSDLPLDAIHKIVEKVKPIDRLSLRKVCRNFRAIVDDKDPGIKHVGFFIEGFPFQMWLRDAKSAEIYYKFGYSKCSVLSSGNSNKVFEGENCMKMVQTDLLVVMKNPKQQLESLEFYGYEGRVKYKETIMNWFKEMSDSNSLYKVKRVDLNMNVPNFAATILPLVQPGILEESCIDFYSDPDNLDQLFGMEQWKRAKSIKIFSYEKKHFPIENLFHLTSFRIETAFLLVADAIKIRNVLLKSAVFEKGCIISKASISVDVMRVFDPNFIVREPFPVDHYFVPDMFQENSVVYDAGNGSQFCIKYRSHAIDIKKMQ